jgi:transcription elongation GreA/GreB family factor
LKEELAGALAADLSMRERAYTAAREGATHEEAKPENDKDTRALEQSYLARGEAARIDALRSALTEVQALPVRVFGADEPIALGALVATEEEGVRKLVWLAPHGGGKKLADGTVHVVTPDSPVGRTLLGKRPGDECELALAKKTRTLTIVAVH